MDMGIHEKDISITGYRLVPSNISYSGKICILVFIRIAVDCSEIKNVQCHVPVISFLVNINGKKSIVSGYYKLHAQSLGFKYTNAELMEYLIKEWSNIINIYGNIPVYPVETQIRTGRKGMEMIKYNLNYWMIF